MGKNDGLWGYQYHEVIGCALLDLSRVANILMSIANHYIHTKVIHPRLFRQQWHIANAVVHTMSGLPKVCEQRGTIIHGSVDRSSIQQS